MGFGLRLAWARPTVEVTESTTKTFKAGGVTGQVPVTTHSAMSASGFDLQGKWEFLSFMNDRVSLGTKANYGMAWGNFYAQQWGFHANAGLNLLNGNVQVSGALGYSGADIQLRNVPSQDRHGVAISVDLSARLWGGPVYGTAQYTRLWASDPMDMVTLGAMWTFGDPAKPPIDLDGTLERQSFADAQRLFDDVRRRFDARVVVDNVGGKELHGRISAANLYMRSLMNDEQFADLPTLSTQISNINDRIYNSRNLSNKGDPTFAALVDRFKGSQLAATFHLFSDYFRQTEIDYCEKAAENVEAGLYIQGGDNLDHCKDNLIKIQAALKTLDPHLEPLPRVELSTVMRNINCYLIADECTSDRNRDHSVVFLKGKIAEGNKKFDPPVTTPAAPSSPQNGTSEPKPEPAKPAKPESKPAPKRNGKK